MRLVRIQYSSLNDLFFVSNTRTILLLSLFKRVIICSEIVMEEMKCWKKYVKQSSCMRHLKRNTRHPIRPEASRFLWGRLVSICFGSFVRRNRLLTSQFPIPIRVPNDLICGFPPTDEIPTVRARLSITACGGPILSDIYLRLLRRGSCRYLPVSSRKTCWASQIFGLKRIAGTVPDSQDIHGVSPDLEQYPIPPSPPAE
jgi:hypothetical protein